MVISVYWWILFRMSDMKKGDIVTLVLINGAEIVGSFKEEGTAHYIINKPRLVQPNQNGIGLVSGVCMTGIEPKGDMSFNKTGVLYAIETVEQIANGYKQQTTGIVTPEKKLIV